MQVAVISGRTGRLRAASRASALSPVISRSISKMASKRLTASCATGEISSATFLPFRAVPLMSASSKNLRRACDQHSALIAGVGLCWAL